MTIATLDDYIAAKKQLVPQKKSASMTSVANIVFSPFALAGNPGAGTLAGANTTTGVVPTDADAGFPIINAFDGGASGYISRVYGYNSVASTIFLADVLLKMGAFAYNVSASGLTTTSFSSRVPGGTDYTGCELWMETVTAFTGNQTIAVTYLDQGGAAGTTGSIATAVAPTVGRILRLPLAAGDTGISGITGVTSTVSSAGTFNLLIVRPLVEVRIPFAGYSEQRDLYGTGMPEVFANSALACYVRADSTATGLPEFTFEVANK